jgi:hypothetical protein
MCWRLCCDNPTISHRIIPLMVCFDIIGIIFFRFNFILLYFFDEIIVIRLECWMMILIYCHLMKIIEFNGWYFIIIIYMILLMMGMISLEFYSRILHFSFINNIFSIFLNIFIRMYILYKINIFCLKCIY